jgi:hypothetical protein
VACLIAVGVTSDGAGWLAFRIGTAWRRLAAMPDALVRNLLTKVPKAAHGLVAKFVRAIFAQPDEVLCEVNDDWPSSDVT